MLLGYKTYIVSAIMVTYGVFGYLLGEMEAPEAARWVLEGGGFSALRAGIAKMR